MRQQNERRPEERKKRKKADKKCRKASRSSETGDKKRANAHILLVAGRIAMRSSRLMTIKSTGSKPGNSLLSDPSSVPFSCSQERELDEIEEDIEELYAWGVSSQRTLPCRKSKLRASKTLPNLTGRLI